MPLEAKSNEPEVQTQDSQENEPSPRRYELVHIPRYVPQAQYAPPSRWVYPSVALFMAIAFLTFIWMEHQKDYKRVEEAQGEKLTALTTVISGDVERDRQILTDLESQISQQVQQDTISLNMKKEAFVAYQEQETEKDKLRLENHEKAKKKARSGD